MFSRRHLVFVVVLLRIFFLTKIKSNLKWHLSILFSSTFFYFLKKNLIFFCWCCCCCILVVIVCVILFLIFSISFDLVTFISVCLERKRETKHRNFVRRIKIHITHSHFVGIFIYFFVVVFENVWITFGRPIGKNIEKRKFGFGSRLKPAIVAFVDYI